MGVIENKGAVTENTGVDTELKQCGHCHSESRYRSLFESYGETRIVGLFSIRNVAGFAREQGVWPPTLGYA